MDFNEPVFNEPDFNEPDFNETDSNKPILMNWVDDLPIWWFQPSCFQDLCVVVSISYI